MTRKNIFTTKSISEKYINAFILLPRLVISKIKKYYNPAVSSVLTLVLIMTFVLLPYNQVEAGTRVWATATTTSWVVPAGVTSISIKAWGGGGGGGGNFGGNGGGGGFVGATVTVTPGETLNIEVGGGGGAGTVSSAVGSGGGGGGHTEIRRSATVLALAAGGGGGGGRSFAAGAGGAGGAGGGTSGVAGGGTGGGDFGDASAGGSGGAGGDGASQSGGAGQGAAGGTSCNAGNGGGSGGAGGAVSGGQGGDDYLGASYCDGGGGGGSGYFGGEGGAGASGSSAAAAGGGGGSSYTIAGATSVTNTAGSGQSAGNNGDSNYAGNAGQGGSSDTAGNAGRLYISYAGGVTSDQTIFTKPVLITEDAGVTGALSKGSGTFVIDHPLDPTRRLLFHSFVESPDVKNIYDGLIRLDNNGEAIVKLPDYFEALNKDYRFLLTPIGKPAPELFIQSSGVVDNKFTIAGGPPNTKVSWQVTGIRQDPYILANPIINEVLKTSDTLVDVNEYLFKGYLDIIK